MRTEWCISPNGGQRKPANNSRHPNPHSIIATINWKFFFMISLSFSPRGPHEIRDLVGRAEALSALTTTVGQCTKLPNARTKVHNAIAVMSWKCFMGLVPISHWSHWLALILYIRDDPCNPWELFKLTLPKTDTPRWRHSPTKWCTWFACWSQLGLVGCTLGWSNVLVQLVPLPWTSRG